MTAKTDNYQVGFNALAARNFVLDTDVAGALRFKRGQANQTPVSTPMFIDKDDNLRLLNRAGMYSGFGVQADSTGKNILMNSDAVINQRVTGAQSAQGAFYCDRWRVDTSLVGSYTMQGIGWIDLGGNYGAHRAIVGTPKPALAVGDYCQFSHAVEGIYIRDLAWGSGNGADFQQAATFSCWAYCSVAPYTFCVNFRSSTGGAASYVHPFTLTNAGVWTRVTHMIPAPTIGTFATDFSVGLQFSICVAAASNGTYTTPNADVWQAQNFIAHSSISNFVGNPAGTAFAVAGLQVEPGKVASRYQKPNFLLELIRCQRYYETSYQYGLVGGTSAVDGQVRCPAFDANTLLCLGPLFKVQKRTTGAAFNVWQTSSGVIHNVRSTSSGASVPLSNYGTIGVTGPNLLSSNAGFTAGQYYEFQWAAEL